MERLAIDGAVALQVFGTVLEQQGTQGGLLELEQAFGVGFDAGRMAVFLHQHRFEIGAVLVMMDALEQKARHVVEGDPLLFLPLGGAARKAVQIEQLDQAYAAGPEGVHHGLYRAGHGVQVRGQGEGIPFTEHSVEGRFAFGIRSEGAAAPLQSGGFAVRIPAEGDHGGADVGPDDLEAPGVEEGCMPARAARGVEDAVGMDLLKEPSIEGFLPFQACGPVDHGVVDLGPIQEETVIGGGWRVHEIETANPGWPHHPRRWPGMGIGLVPPA